ncbi:MAG: DUF167 domain-containing protein [Treponema sp.]|jgi:uncharacterized protein (TIGR00251 family)|nr:DUF167 domain-containing protein [Treponema sp.]
MKDVYSITEEALLISIRAVPGASKTCIAGIQENHLRVKIAAAPEDGKANAELCSFLAKLVGCSKKNVSLIHGEKSRLKTIAVPLKCREAFEGLLKEEREAGTSG